MNAAVTHPHLWLHHLRRQNMVQADRLWQAVPKRDRQQYVSEALRILATAGEMDTWCTVVEGYRPSPEPGDEGVNSLIFRLNMIDLLDHQPTLLTDAQVNRLKAMGQSPKDLAAAWETMVEAQLVTVNALVRMGADPYANGAALFRRLRALGQWEIVENLVGILPPPKNGLPPEVLTTIAHGLAARPSLWAVATDRFGLFEVAKTALLVVAKAGFVPGVQWCLEAYPDALRPRAAGSALEQAASWNQPEVARLAVSQGAVATAITAAFITALLQNDAALVSTLAPHTQDWAAVHKSMIGDRQPPEWSWLDRAAECAPEAICESWVHKAPASELPMGRARVEALKRAAQAGPLTSKNLRPPRARA